MDDLQLELSFSEDSGPDDPQSSDESDDDIDSSGVEEVEDGEDSDASDTVEETVEQPPSLPGAMKENNNNKSKSKLMHNGDELFPPGGSKGSRASKAWLYGGLKKDGKGKLLTDKMYCGLCPKEIKYNQSPGGLSDHLNHNHMEAMIEMMDEKKTQPKLTDFRFEKTKVVEKYKASDPKQKAFRSSMRDWIVSSKRPFNLANDDGFRKVIKGLDPRITVPTGQTVNNDVSAEYVKRRRIQKEKFKDVEYFTSTNDGGTSLANSSFIAVNVHWIDKDFNSKKKMIDMNPVEGKKADEYRRAVDESLDKHGIKDKTFNFTTDNENTMKASFPSHERSGCFAHIESKACQKALKDSKSLELIRKKLRKISRKSNKSPKFKRNVKKEQKSRQIKVIAIKQEVVTRFTSTKIMFDSFLPSEAGEEIVPEEAKKNVEAINAAMRGCLSSKEFKKLEITEKDTAMILNTLPTLKILEEGITKLGGEKFSTGSIVLTFLSRFLVFLDGDEEDPTYLRAFKKKLQKEMIKRCNENLNIKVLALSSFCDMRYSRLKFLDTLQKYKVTKITKEDIINEFKSELEVLDNDHMEQDMEPKQKKVKKMKSFLDDDDDEDDENSDGRSTASQLESYMKEVPIKSKECPGAWWRLNQTKYPDIARLARKYLAVQGTSTPAERVMSDMGIILNKKRLAMTDENFRMLMYLTDAN